MPDALIWGASGGMGSELVKVLKENDWRVFAAARDEEKIPPQADFSYSFDAADPASIANAVRLSAFETEGVELVVYAAGGLVAGTLDKTPPEAWAQVMSANLTGPYLAGRESISLLRKGGQMMFIGAYVEKITLPRMGAYATAKAGLETLVTIFQKENRNIKMTLVRPPAVDTPFWENVPFKMPESALKPDTIARAILEHYHKGSSGELNL